MTTIISFIIVFVSMHKLTYLKQGKGEVHPRTGHDGTEGE